MGEKNAELYKRAIDKWGVEPQIWMAIEEMGELIAELSHHARGRSTVHKVAGEIADVKIMMEQLSVIFGECTVHDAKSVKIKRLEAMVEDE